MTVRSLRFPILSLRRLAGLGCAALLGTALLAPAAAAQSVEEQLQRLRQEIQTLQRTVYGGQPAPAGAAGAVTGGDLDKSQGARIELRLSQIESQIRTLTGQVEEVGYRIDRTSKRLDDLVSDVDQRLQRLEQGAAVSGGGLPPQPGQPGLAQAPQQLPQFQQPQLQQPQLQQPQLQQPQLQQPPLQQPQQGTTFDQGPQILGAVPAENLEALRQQAVEQGVAPTETGTTGAPQTAALRGETPKQQYDYAFALLSQANYPEAERALSAFLDSYPDDPLAGNAMYWLGETHYVRGQFRQAAVTFAEGYQRYPDNTKAPDNLLKLGKSLSSLGESPDACGTFDELLKRYPDAAANILQQARSERQRLSCP